MTEQKEDTQPKAPIDPFQKPMGCGFAIVLVLSLLAAVVISVFFWDDVLGFISPLFFFATLGLLFAAFAGMKLFHIPWQPLFGTGEHFRANNSYIGFGLLIIFCSMGIFYGKILLVYLIAPDWVGDFAARGDMMELDFGDSFLAGVLLFLAVVIIGPIAEEILFRGILFTRWSRVYGPARAAFYSSLLFGVLHANAIGLFFAGWVLCMVYMYTRSLWIPIAIHILNNFLAVVMYQTDFSVGMISADWINENMALLLGFVGITLIMVRLAYVFLLPAAEQPMPFDANQANQAMSSNE